MAAYDTHALII